MSTAAQTHTIWFCLISDGSLPHRDWCDDWGKLDLRLGDNHPRRCGPRREMNATGSGSKPHTHPGWPTCINAHRIIIFVAVLPTLFPMRTNDDPAVFVATRCTVNV